MNQEVTNYLLAYENMKIIQRKDMFNFSLDTVLLANFCSINKNVEKIIDFGTNNAAIPLLLSTRTKTNIVGVEIQEEAVDLARKNVALNNLENQITIVNQDIKEYVKNNRRVKLVVCNPPFFKLGEKSHLNDNEYQWNNLELEETQLKLDGTEAILDQLYNEVIEILEHIQYSRNRPDLYLNKSIYACEEIPKLSFQQTTTEDFNAMADSEDK